MPVMIKLVYTTLKGFMKISPSLLDVFQNSIRDQLQLDSDIDLVVTTGGVR